MNRDERRVILGWVCVAIAIACCVAGFITLLRGRIGAGVVFMVTMFCMMLYVDDMFSIIPDHKKYDKALRLLEDEE